ncbi:MAG: fibronectin type III domain-containing protein, partial [Bacteroidota bacterium]
MTGLTPGTTYYVRAFAKNAVGYGYGDQVYFTTVNYPSTQASNLRFSNVTRNSIGLAWDRGNGNGRVVFIKGSRFSTAPLVDGVTYSASTTYGSGTMIDRGAYCVYNS